MKGKRNLKNPRLVYGVGVNDASYVTQVKSTGLVCPFFLVWRNMLRRAYSKVEHAKRPSYAGSSVCSEWLSFMSFRAWMDRQDWKGKQLDKDLLSPGNKEYRPDRCCFVSHQINSFLTDSAATRGELPLGVTLHKATGKYAAQIHMSGKGRKHIGLFVDPEEAHRAWLHEKNNLAMPLAAKESNPRISAALSSRYSTWFQASQEAK